MPSLYQEAVTQKKLQVTVQTVALESSVSPFGSMSPHRNKVPSAVLCRHPSVALCRDTNKS